MDANPLDKTINMNPAEDPDRDPDRKKDEDPLRTIAFDGSDSGAEADPDPGRTIAGPPPAPPEEDPLQTIASDPPLPASETPASDTEGWARMRAVHPPFAPVIASAAGLKKGETIETFGEEEGLLATPKTSEDVIYAVCKGMKEQVCSHITGF